MHPILKNTRFLATTLALCLASAPTLADSTSSASSASSTSVGSSSASIEKSSNSSSANNRVAQGPYTIIEVMAVAEQPDMLRLRLQAAVQTDATEFFLLLPRHTAEHQQLATGQTISAEHRPYGLAFATLDATGSANPFFLVLDDDWFRELESRPVGG